MKHMKNKGQGAMEYLMTYGWAILVVMIVGVVLWQLGVFSPSAGGTTAKDWTKLQPLVPTVSWTGGSGNFQASFNNAAGTSITIQSISIADLISGQVCTTGTQAAAINSVGYNVAGPATWQKSAGAVSVGTGNIAAISITCPFTKNKGDAYQMALAINYTSVVGPSSVNHIENGTIRGVAE